MFGVVALGNLNADGKPDLVVANYGSNTVSVLLNTTTTGAATPTFAAHVDYQAGSNPFGLAIGDLNGDGELDLAVTNRYSNTVSTMIGNGDGTFGWREDLCTGIEPFAVAIGDLNGDGRRDLALVNRASDTASLPFNTRTFTVGIEPHVEKQAFDLLPPRPNPTRGVVEFRLTSRQRGRVRAEVFDLTGRLVVRLANDEMFTPGLHSLTWNGRATSGRRVVSGVYLVRVSQSGHSAARKFVVTSE